jgi:hypothetical protein
MNFLDDNYKLTNNLDEKFDKLKCMEGTNSKTIVPNENHIYMDESYKMDEIWMNVEHDELLDDNWK